MKDCVIGGCYNYNYDQIKYWINSINRCGFEGDKVLIIFDASEELVKQVEDQGFIVVRETMDPNVAPHVMRFIHIHNYLAQHDYRFVITTDVRDVVFQKNPIPWMERNLQNRNLVVSSECLKYKDEPWGNQNLYDTYGPYIYSKYKDNIIYNVGVWGGRGEFVRDTCLDIAVNCINRPVKVCDQAVFNFMIQSAVYRNNTLFATMNHGWAAHLGTTADPSKMHYFKPNLLENEAMFDGKTVSSAHTDCIFAHQYDRTPWRYDIEEIYK